jgi:A/G-specific adenine glycosylase
MDFAEELVAWYGKNKRSLPWRGTKDPYKIWLSEIILQQTRVDQGMDYYHAFVENYPDVHALAKAGEDRVLKTWEGLGYYSRARNLHATAKRISVEMGGRFPETHAGLLELKGIGDYTASAISSICYNEAQPVVDGNVFRFLSRHFGIRTPIDSTKGKKEFRALAAELITEKDPGTFNQAMMEFGARQCTPRNPDCGPCVFRLSCVALKKKLVDQLPVKEKKTKVTERVLIYVLLKNEQHTFIRQRIEKDIWQGLYEFPLVHLDSAWSDKNVSSPMQFQKAVRKIAGGSPVVVKAVLAPVTHVLSHQKLKIIFVHAEAKGKIVLRDYRRVRIDALPEFAFPIVLKKNLPSFFYTRHGMREAGRGETETGKW